MAPIPPIPPTPIGMPPPRLSSIFSLWRSPIHRMGAILVGAAAEQSVIEHKHNNGADHGKEHAVEIETGNPARPDRGEHNPANDRANDAEYDIEEKALAGFVDDLASYKAGNETQDNPANYRHNFVSLLNCVPALLPVEGKTSMPALRFPQNAVRGR